MLNPISFIYDHWHSGAIGLVILAVVFVVAVVVACTRGDDK